jgi:hypothetical protein
MPANTFTLSGTYIDAGKIRLASGKVLAWDDLSPPEAGPPEVPYGTKMKLTIVLEAPDYLHGIEGAVWATYDRYQAGVVQSALQAQQISCDLREVFLNDKRLFVVHIRDPGQAEAAMDFVWREPDGLMLQPDWCYPAGAANESFLRWIEGR